MGILSDMGPVLSFEDGNKIQYLLKSIALRQFLNVFHRYKTWNKPEEIQQIKWGQEIEGNLLHYNQEGSLELLKCNVTEDYPNLDFPLMFQYGSYMFEMIPTKPYNTRYNLEEIIYQLRHKYSLLHSERCITLTIPCIPFLGVRDNKRQKSFINNITKSQYISDDLISPHPRYATMTKNIRMRRGRTVDIRVPLLIDEKTDIEEIRKTNEPYDGQIYLDAMCFGTGMCCLQCTFSTKNLDHARYVHDQFNVLSPLFLALTAGTPIVKGKLSDWDVRWNIISGSVDDRTQEQRNPQHPKLITDFRYSSSNYYLWNGDFHLPQYNDFDLRVTQQEKDVISSQAQKMKIDIDDIMVYHLANIMKRDFLIVHENFAQMSDQQHHLFDILNSTIWNSVRLKIPIDQDIGWRVEFRTMEVQLTPDENAAYSLILHLITKVLHQTQNLNFYIPISKLRQNFNRAHKKDALRKQKFYFRTNVLEKGAPIIKQLSLHEIFFGKDNFEGIYPLLMQRMDQDLKACQKVKIITTSIEKFLKQKTSGQRLTLAQWMRNYVNNDQRYLKNSIVPKEVMDDMLIELYMISNGSKEEDNFKQIFELWEQEGEINSGCCKQKKCESKQTVQSELFENDD